MKDSLMKIVGYDRLGAEKNEGLRFVWKKDNYKNLIESAAFINRRKGFEESVCGYTTSVSSGCILSKFNSQCTFCRTGNLIPFNGLLSFKDIAKQNIFMVLADMNCKDNPILKTKQREFAYMGQGEPGYSYSEVRKAIELTNRVMRELGQTVYRHVFATCGIPNAICQYKEDVKKFFTEKVTLHFSLHATEKRNDIMPINKFYPYQETIREINEVFDITGEKPCVGIMLFQEFEPKSKAFKYTNSFEIIKNILLELDPKKCRLSFCEYNGIDDIATSRVYSKKDAKKIVQLAEDFGFEAKLFSSFGKEKQTACGMLAAKRPEQKVSRNWIMLDEMANELIKKNINADRG